MGRRKLKLFARATAPALAIQLLSDANATAPPLHSAALRAEFQRLNPCPATGSARGPCPGWQIDHREALVCGGRDELPNLQWLTVNDHKEKTRVEVKLCRGR